DANGLLYVLTFSNVVAVAANGNITTVITNGVLTAPAALAYDRLHGQLLVAEGGSDQRIHRFTTNGIETATYGRQGGRLDGAYVGTNFFEVSDLACDNAGGFYAVEPNGVRRIVHVRADGTIAKEWLGGVRFYAAASADPASPSEVWYNASEST